MRIITVKTIVIPIIVIVLMTPILLWLFYPPYPSKWLLIKPGLTELEVYQIMRGTYTSPIGLEQEGGRMNSKEYYYGLGQYMYIAGKEYLMVVNYDKPGREGTSRKVVNTNIECSRVGFIRFIDRFRRMFW